MTMHMINIMGEVDNGKPRIWIITTAAGSEYFYMGEFQDGKRSGSGYWYTTSSLKIYP